MAAYIVLTRIVFAQRGVIGTLRASGFTRQAMRRHYMSYGVRLGLIGGAVGVVTGILLAWGLTGLYTDLLGIPDAVRELHLITPVVGLLFGLTAGALSALAPARAVARMAPAEAMRGPAPADGGRPSLFERLVPPLRRSPVRWRMTLRGIGRNKKRSFSTVLGVVLALTLILASWGMIDTMLNLMDRQFNEIALEDAAVVFVVEVGAEQVASVESDPAIDHAEIVVGFSATVKAPGGSYATALESYEANTRVHGFPEPLPADGIVAGAALADVIGVEIGDEVTVELPTLESSFKTELKGFVDEPLGTLIYMSSGGLERALATAVPEVDAAVLSSPGAASVKAVFAPDAVSATVVNRLEQVPDVAAVVDSKALQDIVESFQAFFYLFVGVMLLFGGAMAFALIFNTISVNVAERSGEFATMRANGLSHRRVASLIAGENILLTCMGIIPGLIIGYAVAAVFMQSYSSDQFSFAISMRPISLMLSALAMIVVAVLSLIPAIRAVKRLDIGAIVRERAV
jgi:putative ABC transport system permease protein